MKYLIRIAMMGLSLASITPVAHGATLDSPVSILEAPALLSPAGE